MVFDAPNKGAPSLHLAPLSRGRENRSPKIFFATTGVPFASIIRNSSRVITQSCIPSCYLSGLETSIDPNEFLQGGLGRVSYGSGANFKKGRRADPGALGERESLACQIGPKLKLCTRSSARRVYGRSLGAPIQCEAFCATKSRAGKYTRSCHAEDQSDSRMEVRAGGVDFGTCVSTLCSRAAGPQIQPKGIGGSEYASSGDKGR